MCLKTKKISATVQVDNSSDHYYAMFWHSFISSKHTQCTMFIEKASSSMFFYDFYLKKMQLKKRDQF
jgi:hypothetical protein